MERGHTDGGVIFIGFDFELMVAVKRALPAHQALHILHVSPFRSIVPSTPCDCVVICAGHRGCHGAVGGASSSHVCPVHAGCSRERKGSVLTVMFRGILEAVRLRTVSLAVRGTWNWMVFKTSVLCTFHRPFAAVRCLFFFFFFFFFFSPPFFPSLFFAVLAASTLSCQLGVLMLWKPW